MPHRLAALCLVVLSGSYAQSLLAQNSSPGPTSTPSLEQRVSDLEKKLQSIESIPIVAMALKMNGSAQANSTPEANPTPQSDAPLELMKWEYRFKAGQYEFQSRHLFSYILKNRTDKSIKLVDGSILFTDLLGEKLMSIRLLQDIIYSPREPAPASGEWSVNQFESGEQRMSTVNHDDVKAILVVRRVVFGDNSVWSEQEQHQ